MIDIQTLIANVVTLAAALIGFWGVIYSQRKLSRMALDDRQHQERLAQEQVRQQRQLERESFVNAVLGELQALQFSLDGAGKLLAAQVSIAEELARMGTGRKTQPRVAFHFATPVFDSLVANIGLLKPSLSFAMSKLYGQFKSYSIQSQDQVPEMEAALAVRVMQSVQQSLRNLRDEAETLKTALVADTAEPTQPKQG